MSPLHLISDLLALARGDERKTHFEQEPVRLDLLAEAVVSTMQPLAQEREINLDIQTAEPATLLGDEARLMQVVMNVLENALYATAAGGHVLLIVKSIDQHAQIIVKDSGCGIAPEHLPHIFERFYRVDSARTSTGNRNGLGLAIVEWIVRMHQGQITVESQVGAGTTFTITLPNF